MKSGQDIENKDLLYMAGRHVTNAATIQISIVFHKMKDRTTVCLARETSKYIPE